MNYERLRLIHAFARLTPRELAAIAVRAQEESTPAGTVLIREGDYAVDLIGVIHGEVEVTRDGSTLAVLGAGELVGELGCLSGQRRTATVTATEPVQFVRLTHWDVRHLERIAPEALSAIRGVADQRRAA